MYGEILAFIAKYDPVADDEDSDGSPLPLIDSSGAEEVDCPVNTSEDEDDDEEEDNEEQLEFNFMLARFVATQAGESASDEGFELCRPGDKLKEETVPQGFC